MALLTMRRGFADDDELTDPFLGQPDAIAAGRVTYARQVLRLPPQFRRAGTEPLRDEAQRPALSGDGDPGPQGNANASLRPAPVAGRGVADSRLREVDGPLLRRPAYRTVFTNLRHLDVAPGAAQLAA
jgi:hypothetical protein